MSEEADFAVSQERDRVANRTLFLVGAGGVLITLVAIFLAGVLLYLRDGRVQPRAIPAGAQPSVAPTTIGMIEQTPIEYTERGIQLRNTQRRELGRFAWVDRDAGIVSIPIDRAERLLLEDQKRAPGAAQKQTSPQPQRREESSP